MARYFDIHPDNPQVRSIRQVAQILRERGLIAYPTDSLYALGSALGNQEGKDRILRLRNLDERHDFTLVCADFSQRSEERRVGKEGRSRSAPHPCDKRKRGSAARRTPDA